MKTPEISSPGFLEAKINNGQRSQMMSRIGVSLGFVIDMRKEDKDLWEHLRHGAIPLKPDITVYGDRVQDDIDEWKKDLGDDVEVLLVPVRRFDGLVRYSWGPVKRADLDREPAALHYMAANVSPQSVRELSLILAYEVITGKSFSDPQTNPVVISGQRQYEA